MLNINKDKKYLLACSYGPDSMALFHILLENGFHFDVAHVNYHLRKESDAEEEGLRAFCKEKGVKLYVYQNVVQFKNNIEARCRDVRYTFFKSLYELNKYDALLVAHQQDDHLETYLLQKDRKNLVNYYGIAPETEIMGMKVIRPLLNLTKKDTEQICDRDSIPYAVDKTNLLPIFKRNKIRLGIINKLLPRTRDALLEEIKQKNVELGAMFKKLDCLDNKIETLLKLNPTEFAYYLNRKIKEINQKYSITYKQCCEIGKIMLSSKSNVIVFLEKQNVIVEKSYDCLLVKKYKTFTGYKYVMNEPSIMDNEYFFANFLGDTSNRNISLSDYPLTIRSFRKNDQYKIKDYTVLVRRLFIDWKMPLEVRKVWPIILNKDGKVIYIPRYRKDFVPDENTNFYVKECFTLK